MFEIKVDAGPAKAFLVDLAGRVEDMTPLYREIAGILYEETMLNFDAQGRPSWVALKQSTIDARVLKGYTPIMILRARGDLKRAIVPFYDANSAGLSVAHPAAAIHQLGGQAGRGGSAAMPARPYLPVTASGELQPEAESKLLEAFNDYLGAAIRG